MAQRKGQTGNPNGRPAGTPNKATQNAREAIAAFVEGNVERLNGWLDRIADENPKAAFDCLMSVCEYHIPKLARQEISIPAPIKVEHSLSEKDQEILDRFLKGNKTA